MARIELTVDGHTVSDEVEPRMLLVQYLREKLGKTGTVIGCDTSNCGACTVHVDGKPVYSCMMLAIDAAGKKITTVEGLGTPEKMDPVQAAFVEHDALMCGFCTPGFVMSIRALLNRTPKPNLEQVKEACAGNLCRCGTYPRVFDAALAAAGVSSTARRADADTNGHGVINLLAADKLINQPKLYAIFLLWLLAELFEQLPEVGDPEQPKLVFFFDEAHLLFNDAPEALLSKIEQVVRLIRSKGVGVYFVTQNPLDIPDSVLGQLGNRVQHALRAFTPRDQKAVKAAAQTLRANPAFDAETAITELGVGEALVSFLDEKGRPNVVERAMVIAPESKMGMLGAEGLNSAINKSPLYGRYEDMVDRESAYEKLSAEGFATVGKPQPGQPASKPAQESAGGGLMGGLNEILFGSTGPRGGKRDGIVQTAAKSMARDLGRQILRGVLGSIMGGRKK